MHVCFLFPKVDSAPEDNFFTMILPAIKQQDSILVSGEKSTPAHATASIIEAMFQADVITGEVKVTLTFFSLYPTLNIYVNHISSWTDEFRGIDSLL